MLRCWGARVAASVWVLGGRGTPQVGILVSVGLSGTAVFWEAPFLLPQLTFLLEQGRMSLKLINAPTLNKTKEKTDHLSEVRQLGKRGGGDRRALDPRVVLGLGRGPSDRSQHPHPGLLPSAVGMVR